MSLHPSECVEVTVLDGTVEPLRAVPVPPTSVNDDPVIEQLRERLRSLDNTCLAGLQEGLARMLEGDNTFSAQPGTEPIYADSADPHVRALVDIFNSMLQRSQEALAAYETLRVRLADALGDVSCLPELTDRLHSLEENCLADLDEGLQAVVEGDLTRAAQPITKPLRAQPDTRLGELGTSFNRMLARSRTALHSYDTMREDLRNSLGDRSCLEELRAKLYSLHRHCLRDLDEGLAAAVSGTTLTRQIAPVTSPLVPLEPDADIGEIAEVFNRMLARTQTTLTHYDELRTQSLAELGGSFVNPRAKRTTPA